MNSDPTFADYDDMPDRLLRDDEIDEDFIAAVVAVGATLPGWGSTSAAWREAASAKIFRRDITTSKITALADRLRKEKS